MSSSSLFSFRSWRRAWRRMWGCSSTGLTLFRISLSVLIFIELALRFRYVDAFYSRNGTLPRFLLWPKVDGLYKMVCIHLWNDEVWYQYFLLSLHLLATVALALNVVPRLAAFCCWFLYLSLTLRNTWLSYILDRYFHYLLLYATLLPLKACSWSALVAKNGGGRHPAQNFTYSLVTMAVKLQVLWIYLDAGYGKYSDPLGGWTFGADPLPALDTYLRHTMPARYLYAWLGPLGLRLLTPTVVWVELGAVPVVLLASLLDWPRVALAAMLVGTSLHLGIAITLRNTGLLSLVAIAAWFVLWPGKEEEEGEDKVEEKKEEKETTSGTAVTTASMSSSTFSGRQLSTWIPLLAICGGSIWFEWFLDDDCQSKSQTHIWSTLLHNRWNVFVGAEEYVTWEMAPGRLANGQVVDVWSLGKNPVNWEMPGTGAPCTSTARGGRWRSFPYLADLETPEEVVALWMYLCRQWNAANPENPLLRFNFFMLQADVLPEMAFSMTRKRLIHSQNCFPTSDADANADADADAGEEPQEKGVGAGPDEL